MAETKPEESEDDSQYQKFAGWLKRAMDERDADAIAKKNEEREKRTESKKSNSILGSLFS